MTLATISVLKVRFLHSIDEPLIDELEAILDVLKIHTGCLGYSMSMVQHVSNSVFISGYWCDESAMQEHFLSAGFATLLELLMARTFNMEFKTFYMHTEEERR